jgi:ankyrin repeat protein
MEWKNSVESEVIILVEKGLQLNVIDHNKDVPDDTVNNVKADLDEYGDSALHNAAMKRQVADVSLLLDAPSTKAALLDLQNLTGQSALHVATFVGAREVVELLLQHGAKTDLLDRDGDSALYYAVKK